jgi:hypothetical protein
VEYDEDDPLREVKKYDDFIEGKIQMTAYLELEKRGCAPPMIEDLSDADVTRELTNLLWNLADLGIYISDIDHLDDRTAYADLCAYCDEPNMFFPGNKNSATHYSPIGSGTDEDTEIYLRYYADDETRERWAKDFGDPLPPSELPPYPRPWIPVWEPFRDEEE